MGNTDRAGTPSPAGWLRHWAQRQPDAVAVVEDDATWTYRQLDACATRWRRRLQQAGLRPGDRVATLTANRAEHYALFFACAQAGLVLAPLSWRLTGPELAAQLAVAAPAALVCDERYAALGASAAGPGPRRFAFTGTTPALEAAEADPAADEDPDVPDSPVHDDTPLLMMFTGGTTGGPKAALLTHAGCVWTNRSLGLLTGLDRADVVLALLPQFHVAGWNVQPLLALWRGATVVLMRDFDAERALELVERHRVSTMMGVPVTYRMLAETRGFAERDLGSLRFGLVGGAPCPPELLRTWADRGVPVSQGYGLTEAGPNVLGVPPDEAVARIGWAGRPYPFVEAALRDTDTGEVALSGPGVGELLVRGPGVFAGYWRDPEATAGSHVDDWLATGDLAERDEDGYYRIVDRIHDMYISGGENVFPVEVESVLTAHPAVAEAAVVGVPDPRWGQCGVAVVVLRSEAAGGPDLEDELLRHVRARLAGYKVPRRVHVVDRLPRSAMNKVLRTQLRDRFGEYDGREGTR